MPGDHDPIVNLSLAVARRWLRRRRFQQETKRVQLYLQYQNERDVYLDMYNPFTLTINDVPPK